MAQNTSPWSDWTAPTAGTMGGFNPNTAMFGSKRDALNTNDAMAIMRGDQRRIAQLGIRHAGDPFAFTREGRAASADTAGRMALGQQQFDQQRLAKREDFLYKMAGETGVFDVKGALDAKRAQNEQDLKAKALGIDKTKQDMTLAATQRDWEKEKMETENRWKEQAATVAHVRGQDMATLQAVLNDKATRLVRAGMPPEQAMAYVRNEAMDEAALTAQKVEAGKPQAAPVTKVQDGMTWYQDREGGWHPSVSRQESLMQEAMRMQAGGKPGNATPATPSATQPAAPAKMTPTQRSQAEQFIKANANSTDPKVKAQVEGWRRAIAAQGA